MVSVFKNCAIFYEFLDPMRFEVNCAKSHHRVISDGLSLKKCVVTTHLAFGFQNPC